MFIFIATVFRNAEIFSIEVHMTNNFIVLYQKYLQIVTT